MKRASRTPPTKKKHKKRKDPKNNKKKPHWTDTFLKEKKEKVKNLTY